MDIYQRKVLRYCVQVLEEQLEPNDVIDELIKNGVMLEDDKNVLRSLDWQVKRVGYFLNTLQESSENAFESFLDALQKFGTYDGILKVLRTKEQSVKETLETDIQEILSSSCTRKRFMFCEMVCTTAETMTKLEANKISTYYRFSEEENESFRLAENPGFTVMKLLLSKEALKEDDVSTLESVLKELNLINLEKALQNYRKCLDLAGFEIKASFPEQYSTKKEDHISKYKLGKRLKDFFQDNYNAVYEDITSNNCFVLRIPFFSSLESIREDIESEKMAKMLTPLMMVKEFTENVDTLQVSYNEENFKYVRSKLLKEAKEKSNQIAALTAVSQSDFRRYLEKVGLNGKFPARMTLKMATRIRILENFSTSMEQNNIPLLFFIMLTSLDRRAVFPEKLNFSDSIRDFICAFLHCSDDFLKQHVLEKLASCQLAVPLILPSPTGGSPTFLLWALRRVVKKWKGNDGSLTPEKNMVSEPLFTVAVLRMGMLPISKSHILNNMFGRAQSNATVAYFISRREDYQEDATFSKGSLEANWYVPLKGKHGEILTELTLFLNLRGDSFDFPEQVAFASRVADMVFILVDKSRESEQRTGSLVHTIKNLSSNAVIVSLKERRPNTNQSRRKKLIETKNRIEYEVDGEDIVLCIKMCELIKRTCNSLGSKHYRCIENWWDVCQSLNLKINLDEENPSCKRAYEMSEKIFNEMSSLTIHQIKKKFMRLQELEIEWVRLDKQKVTRSAGQTLEIQKDNIRMEKSNIRKEQLSHGLTSLMQTFQRTLRNIALGRDSKLLHYFMVHFQAQIDKKTKKEIPPHIIKLNELESALERKKLQLKDINSDRSNLEKEITNIQKEILSESEKYSQKHFGFEHFMRELSHLFEARYLLLPNNQEETQLMAAIAARLLIDGYPLEILNGDSTYISINWISNVLNIVDKVLYSPKIFVISVIGVQSSGKSTLLNCMFGVRFTVRAGRCTRGLFLQMLEVDERFQKSLGFQYLFIIDTEGLQSPDRTVNNDFKFDNALATLAMSVVDLSILNISQETIGADMIGILQIAAHALIRMKRVKLISRCRIVHQRVSDVNAAGENKSSMNLIKEALDKATLAAANEENITGIKEFSDIFPFTESDNLYVPCLWMGNMSPPNHAYSETILHLKSQILSRKREKGIANSSPLTLKKFLHRLEDVWHALKKEDFVFNFQNSFNALSYQRFRLEHNKWIGTMRTTMVEWELSNKENVKEGNEEVYNKKLKEAINNHLDKVMKEIDEYVDTHSNEEEVMRQQNAFKNASHTIAREIEETIQHKFKHYIKTKEERASLPNFIENCKMMLRENAKQKALEARRNDPKINLHSSKPLLENMFETLWKNKTDELKTAYEEKKMKDESIISACENSLSSLIDNTKYNLQFKDIITSKGGIVVRDNKPGKIPKPPKESKKRWSKLNLGFFSASDKNEAKQKIWKIAVEELNTFTFDERFDAFDKNHIEKFFSTLFEKLREPMKFAEEYALEVLIQICNKITALSISKQRKYEEKYSLYKLMEVEKNELKNDFFFFFDKTITTEKAAARTFTDICAKICEKLTDHLNVHLLKRLRKSNPFTDREFLIGTILCEICENNQQEQYLEFISNQNEFIKCWIKRKIVQEVTKKDNAKLWVQTESSKKLKDLIESIRLALKETKKHFDCQTSPEPYATTTEGRGENIKSRECSVTISKWQNIFVGKCKFQELKITLAPIIFDSVHYMSFTEMLLKMLDETSVSNIGFKPSLESCENPNDAEELILKMDISPHLEILQQLQGCSEVCPFCKVGCQLQGDHKKHKAKLHYPEGLSGFRDYNSKKLVVDICTSLVASDFRYRFQDAEEWRPYKEYASEFPTWDITPIQGDEPNKHWQWVMAQHNDFFARHYHASPGEIPSGWKQLTQSEALLFLKKWYNLK